MVVIFMWVIATGSGDFTKLRYDSMAHCERDRPLIEMSLRYDGFRDIVTVCRMSQERSA